MGRNAGKSAKQITGEPGRLESAWALYHSGKSAKAKSLCRRIARKQADHGGALHLLGAMARDEGRLSYARELLSRAAAADPDNPVFLCDLGNALKALGRHGEAVDAHARVLGLMPDSPEALSNLGSAYAAWGRHDEAVDYLRRAVEGRPGDAELHYNLGNALMAACRWTEAERCFREATDIDPDHIRARANLGGALKEQGRLEPAIANLRMAVDRLPDDPRAALDPARAQGYVDAGWNLGLALLMAGDYREGWLWYEQRRHLDGFAMPAVAGAAWDGAPLDGRTLLIHEEQGLGDTIQFARYAAIAAESGGRVVLRCQKPLSALLSGLAGSVEAIGADAPPPDHDVVAPVRSLPHLLGRPEPFWPDGPYLAADPALAARWDERLGTGGTRVGIAWQGNPGYRADAARSVPLDFFRPLAERSGLRLFGLQKGHGEEQLEAIGWRDRITPLGPDLDNGPAFVDTAAVMTALDLVVTSDTSIVHLAGALGVPVWVPLARVPDWRWGLTGDATPWYPTMRLFRQEKPGDWAGAMARIAEALGAV